MGWFRSRRDLPVWARLVAINALLILTLALVNAVAWRAIEARQRAANQLALISHAQRLHQDADMMHDSLRANVSAALLAADVTFISRNQILADLLSDGRQLRQNLVELARLELPPDLHDKIAAVRPRAESYVSTATHLGQLALEDRPAALARMSAFHADFHTMLNAMHEVTDAIGARTVAAEQESAMSAARAKKWILIGGVLCALLMGLLVHALSRSIRRSLQRVRDVARELAAGNLEVRNEVRSRDEIGEIARAVNRMADELQGVIRRLRAEADRDAFGNQLVQALEMSDTEAEVHAVVARAMSTVSRENPMELLLADSSRAHLERATQHPELGAPGCMVDSPFSCAAVRRGNPVVFPDSEALNACPRLRDRPSGPLSAVCVPLSFMGRSLGVLHVAGPHRNPPPADSVAQLTSLGVQAGVRIGTVRAFERSQIQATTDGLTGLANRRRLEETARALAVNGKPFAFVLADLDHFKRLNDSHGHEAGDKALRQFGDLVRRCLRESDVAARWGGEEFALLMPGATTAQALEIVDRIRAELAHVHAATGSIPFTSSFGIADSQMSARLDELLRIADAALYRAKQEGRDRAAIGDPVNLGGVERAPSEQRAAIDLRLLAAEG